MVHFGDMGGIFPPSREPHILALSIYVALSPQRLRHFFAQLEMAAGRESATKKNYYKHKITLQYNKENNAISIIAFCLLHLNLMRAFD